jgi:hypothetical protein
MSQSPLPKGLSPQGAKPAHTRKAGAGEKRGRLAKMCLGVFAGGASIAAVATFAIAFGTAPSPSVQDAASRAEPNGVGTIVLHSGPSGCQQKSFDNQTGQILNQPSSCHNDVVLDAKGMPIPTGTVHTLNSISKSFQR